MTQKRKIAVIGAGAIGSVMAGYLAQVGEEVVVVGKGEQVRSLKGGGLTIKGVRGAHTVSIAATESLEEEVEVVVLTVKTQDVAETLAHHRLHLIPCLVVTTQNGVRADKIVSEYIDPQRIISGIVMFGATYLRAGKVVHNFEGDFIMGGYHGVSTERVREIARTLEEAFSVVVSEEMRGMKWLKLFVNLNNCLPALIGKSMQETFADLTMCTIGVSLLREGVQLVDRAGITLHSLPTYPVERLRKLVSLPLEEAALIFSQIMTHLSREPLYGSILQSIRRGRPSEIDYINGEIVSLAKEEGCTAPLNERVVEMVHQVEENIRFFHPTEVMGELYDLVST